MLPTKLRSECCVNDLNHFQLKVQSGTFRIAEIHISVYMNPIFTNISPNINKALLCRYLSDDSVGLNSCLESTLGYSNRPVPHQTCLSLQKYNGKMESVIGLIS